MVHWTLEDIPWERFDRQRVHSDMLAVVKAAALVEYNADDYAAYLRNVFVDDADFQAKTYRWSAEEKQHGEALGRWANLADPAFNFAECVQRFREGYRVPVDAAASVRGSQPGELISRCVVESATSSFYSAMHTAASEPVLRAICQRIAADEFRHYRMFYDALKRCQEKESVSRLRRARVAIGRYLEMDDDELAYAFHCANFAGEPYERQRASKAYFRGAFQYYRESHMRRAIGMMAKAAGFDPGGRLASCAAWVAWTYTRWNAHRLATG